MGDLINLDEWYGPHEAVERLSRNSGRQIHKNYIVRLVFYGKVRSIRFSSRGRLYHKEDIDNYQVGTRGKPEE